MIEFTRVHNDGNGNPRYVCHFLAFIRPGECEVATVNKDGSRFTNDQVCQYIHGKSWLEYKYDLALKRSRQFGGRKFHNKQFGGGIVFQTYNIDALGKKIEGYLETLPAVLDNAQQTER